jgi:hypothetical protein
MVTPNPFRDVEDESKFGHAASDWKRFAKCRAAGSKDSGAILLLVGVFVEIDRMALEDMLVDLEA